MFEGLICNGLFSTKFPLSSETKIPTNCFGIFATIVRNKFRLDEWPEDIHGCIGYWNETYVSLSRSEIINWIEIKCHQAMFEDSRSQYFPEFTTDPFLKIEITFMLRPLRKIDSNGIIRSSNKIFDNSIYGIIVDNNKSKRATFLPGVFSVKDSWDKIHQSLLDKAGIHSGESYTMYTYKTVKYKYFLKDLITKLQPHFKTLFQKFVILYIKQYGCVPYRISNGNITCNSDDIIRNLSVLEDMIGLSPYLSKKNYIMVNKIIKGYITKVEKGATLDIQEITNLLRFMKNSDKDKYAWRLEDHLFRHFYKIEREFTLGQIIIEILPRLDISQKGFLKYYLLSSSIKSIFQWCWDLKAFSKLSIDDYERYVHYIIQYKPFLNYESNYLVVAFEGLKILCEKYPFDDELFKIRMDLFMEIIKRMDKKDGFIKFLDGSARMDITSHFLHGL